MTKPFVGNNGKTISTPINHLWTYIDIPVHDFSSLQEEEEWIKVKADKILHAVHTAMSSETFQMYLQARDNRRQRKLASTIYDSSKKTNLPKFLKNATMKVSKIKNLTDLVTVDASETISLSLLASFKQCIKYSEQESESDMKSS